jgi:hypothetical protein
MRPTALSDWGAYRHEARYVFRDRRLRDFMSEEVRALTDGVGTWVESCNKSGGFEALARPDVPALTVSHHEYFVTRTGRERFVRAVEAAPAPLYTLCRGADLAEARGLIESRRLGVGRVRQVEVPFFSQRARIGMMLVEVVRPEGAQGRAALEAFWRSAPFPDDDYRAEITTPEPPARMRPGERAQLRFRVRNAGGFTWPARGDGRGMYQVNLGDRWMDSTATHIVNDLDGRASLAEDLPPGGEAELTLRVKAPEAPGDYVLEIDMIHEGITFFIDKGSTTLRMKVRVEP